MDELSTMVRYADSVVAAELTDTGDDPYWQAEDLHYWQTNNLEW